MTHYRQRKWLGAGLCLLGIAAPVALCAQTADEPAPDSRDSLRVSVGGTYADGRYGQTVRTRIVTVPVSVKYTRGRVSVKVSTAYVHLRGPGTLLDGSGSGASSGGSGSGGGGVASEPEIENEGGSTGTSEGEGKGAGPVTGATIMTPAPLRNRGGLGDTTVTLAYNLPLGAGLSLEPRSRIKLPTASARKGIGTGKVDVTLAADLVGSFGPTTLYASVRRRFLGRTPRFALRDGWGFGAGASRALGPVITLGADYDWLQSATPGRGPISEGTLWISARLSRQLRLQAYGGTGFSARSADAIGGLTLVWRP